MKRKRPKPLAEVLKDRPAAGVATVPRQKLLASIDMFDEDIILTRHGGHEGMETSREYIDADQIVQILSRNKGKDRKAGSLLPVFPGVLAVAVSAGSDAKAGEGRWIIRRPAGPASYQVTVAGKVRTVRLARCPSLLADMRGRVGADGRVSWTALVRVAAVGGDGRPGGAGQKPPRGDEKCYLPPLGDVSPDGGMHLCGVEWKRAAGMDALAALEAVLFRSRFTGASLDVAISDAGRKRYRNVLELAQARKIELANLKEIGSYAKTFA